MLDCCNCCIVADDTEGKSVAICAGLVQCYSVCTCVVVVVVVVVYSYSFALQYN